MKTQTIVPDNLIPKECFLTIPEIRSFFQEICEELEEREFAIVRVVRVEKATKGTMDTKEKYYISVRNIDEEGRDGGGHNHLATVSDVKALLFLSGIKQQEIDTRISKLIPSGKKQTFEILS